MMVETDNTITCETCGWDYDPDDPKETAEHTEPYDCGSSCCSGEPLCHSCGRSFCVCGAH